MSQCTSGDEIVLLASATAIALSKGMSASDTNILANFFNAVGDNLAIIAAQKEACQTDTQSTKNEQDKSDQSNSDTDTAEPAPVSSTPEHEPKSGPDNSDNLKSTKNETDPAL